MGGSTRIDEIEIQWPDGAKEKIEVPGIDRSYTVREGKGLSKD